MTHELATLFKYCLFNVLRARWLLLYSLFFLVFSAALLRFTSEPDKATATLLNVVLFIVPMVGALYGSIYWYNADPFTHLLLTQPLRRSSLLLSVWLAVSAALAGSFAVSTAVSILVFSSFTAASILLLAVGTTLTFIFTAIGMLVSVLNPDRMKGVGLTFMVWLYFAILHDAVVFLLMSMLRDYPIEIPSMILMALNPIDLARVALLLTMDLSAMMGYTGRILQRTISSPAATAFTAGILALWLVLPVLWATSAFRRRDL